MPVCSQSVVLDGGGIMRLVLPFLAVSILMAGPDPDLPPAGPAPVVVGGPLELPADAMAFVRETLRGHDSSKQKLNVLLRAIFQSREMGGMGLTYDNTCTRTVQEVWRDRKANCLSMTAFYIAACRSTGLRLKYAEVLNTSHWRKSGAFVLYERHVVALAPMAPQEDLVADFVPEIRRLRGTYVVALLSEARFLSLYYSNRAVERLDTGDLAGALVEAQRSLNADPTGSVGWNVLGVVHMHSGDLPAAENAFRKALDLDQADGAAIGNLEVLLHLLGRETEAKDIRTRGEKVRKRDPYFQAILAEEALNSGDLDEAERHVKAAENTLPQEVEFRVLAARVFLARGDFDHAIEEIKGAQRGAGASQKARLDAKMDAIRNLRIRDGVIGQPQTETNP
jgi:tetratricopeptide (TPR) repeat protein